MFHHPAHAGIHCRRAPIQTLSSLSGCRVFLRGGFFFHGAIVVQQDGSRISNPIDEDSYSMTSAWPDGTPKSLNNAFTQRPASVFAADKAEQAKATLARKGAHYGQATGAVGHGAAVMPTLSKKAQKLLKATPFSQPIAPSTSGLSKTPRKKASS